MTHALVHGFHANIDSDTAHVETVLAEMAKLGQRAGERIDTHYWDTAHLDVTSSDDDLEYDIVWIAWLAERAHTTPNATRDAPHLDTLARRLETFHGKKKQRPLYLSQALSYMTCAGYMDRSFGAAPLNASRRAVRDNCLLLATHAEACDMPIVRDIFMHLFDRREPVAPDEVLKALLSWILREDSENAGVRAMRILISLEETWKQLSVNAVRLLRLLYKKLFERADAWASSGDAKVLWLGHLHRVQARSSLVQQRAAMDLPRLILHVMASIADAENNYIVQIAMAILYESCLWRNPEASLATVLYVPEHQTIMEHAMGELNGQKDVYPTALQAGIRYFVFQRYTMPQSRINASVYTTTTNCILVPQQSVPVLFDCLGLLQDMDTSFATERMLEGVLCVCTEHLHERILHEELVRTLVHLEPALDLPAVMQQQVARNVLCCLRTTFVHDAKRAEPAKVAWLLAWAQCEETKDKVLVWDEATNNASVEAVLKKMQHDNHRPMLEMLMRAMCLVVWRETVEVVEVRARCEALAASGEVCQDAVETGRKAVCAPEFLQRLLQPYFRPACTLCVERVGVLLLGIAIFAREALHRNGALVRRFVRKVAARSGGYQEVWLLVEAMWSGMTLREALAPKAGRAKRVKLRPLPPRGVLKQDRAVHVEHGIGNDIEHRSEPGLECECVVCLQPMDEDDADYAFCCASAYSLCETCADKVKACVICHSVVSKGCQE